MTDDTNAPGIEVRKGPWFDMATSAVRSVVLVAGVVVALAGLVSKHDWAGAAALVQTEPFIASLATVMAIGSFLWGQWKTRRRAVQLSTAAQSPKVPDEVLKLKE